MPMSRQCLGRRKSDRSAEGHPTHLLAPGDMQPALLPGLTETLLSTHLDCLSKSVRCWPATGDLASPVSAMRWFKAALAWATRCYREDNMRAASAYFILARQYLARYSELPNPPTDSTELRTSLGMISAHVTEAAHQLNDGAKARKAIQRAEQELKRYLVLARWDGVRSVARTTGSKLKLAV